MESIKSFKESLSPNLSNIDLKNKKEYLYKFFKKEDLKIKKYGNFEFFIIPSQYYIWKGINSNSEKNKNIDIEKKDTNEILKYLSSYFFADKETAASYGTSKKNNDDCVDLQFKIIKDIVLLDISSLNTIIALFKYFKNLNIEDLDDNPYLLNDYNVEKKGWIESTIRQKKYPTEKEFFEKRWKVGITELITQTLGNYDPKRDSKGKIGSPNTPTRVERKSKEFSDSELVKLICSINKIDFNGWIYFKNDTGDIDYFHDEIMICKPHGYIEYIDYHKI
tara:strand:- start:322 stop:1155 length:834 start_codon:yes stop_codon:yes gene_type:complete